MRTLSITLCFLLVLAPAQGQQAVRQSAPNFYVPYGVRDLPVAVSEEEYSSSEMTFSEPGLSTMGMPNAPMPRHLYPVRKRRSWRFGPNYGYPAPESTARSEAIMGAVMIGLVVMAFVAGDR